MEEKAPEPERGGLLHRFSKQETAPQKMIIGLAGTVTAIATLLGGVYAVSNVVRDDETNGASSDGTSTSPTSSASSPADTALSPEASAPSATSPGDSPGAGVTVKPNQTLVLQGSPEADDLVHAFVDSPGARVELDVVIVAQQQDKTPQWIMGLWYNCQDLPAGEPPGEDKCDEAQLVFDDMNPSPPRFDRPRRIELRGIWVDNRPSGLGYGAKGLEIYPVPASF